VALRVHGCDGLSATPSERRHSPGGSSGSLPSSSLTERPSEPRAISATEPTLSAASQLSATAKRHAGVTISIGGGGASTASAASPSAAASAASPSPSPSAAASAASPSPSSAAGTSGGGAGGTSCATPLSARQ